MVLKDQSTHTSRPVWPQQPARRASLHMPDPKPRQSIQLAIPFGFIFQSCAADYRLYLAGPPVNTCERVALGSRPILTCLSTTEQGVEARLAPTVGSLTQAHAISAGLAPGTSMIEESSSNSWHTSSGRGRCGQRKSMALTSFLESLTLGQPK